MSKTITATAVISASDKTGNTFDRIASKFRGLEKTAKSMEAIKPLRFTGNLFEELKRLQLSEKQLQSVRREMAALQSQLMADPVGRRPSMYFRAMDDWKDKTVAHWREVRVASDAANAAQAKFAAGAQRIMPIVRSAAAWMGGGYLAYRAGRFAVDQNRAASSEAERQRQSGLTTAQSDAIASEADRQSQRHPTVSATELRAAGREAIMQLGSSQAGLAAMGPLAAFMTVGKPLWGDQMSTMVRKSMQVADALNITDPNRLREFLDAQARASQVEGGADVNPAEMRNAMRTGKAALKGAGATFLASEMPGMIAEMGGDRAGTSVMSLYSGMLGKGGLGQQTAAARAFQQSIGLRDKDGRLIGEELFRSNSAAWADKYYRPTMERRGIDPNDPAAVAADATKVASNRAAGDALAYFMMNYAQRQRKSEQLQGAKGLDGAMTQHTRDLESALAGVSSQLANLATNAKAAEAMTGGLNAVMGGIQDLQKAGVGEFLGTELKKGVNDFKTITSDIAFGISTITGAATTLRDLLRGGTSKDLKNHLDTPLYQDSLKSYLGPADWPTGAKPVPFAGGSDYDGATFTAAQGYRTSGAPRLGGGRWIEPPKFPAPEVSPTMTHGTGVGDVQNVSVAGTISGEAKIEQTLNIQASPYFDAKMSELRGMVVQLAGQMYANGPGSTGRSSPDAAAPSFPSGGHH